MSKISSIKNLFDTIPIEDYIFISGFIGSVTNSDDLVQSADILEPANKAGPANPLLPSAVALVRRVGAVTVNQSVPWCLDTNTREWQRIVQCADDDSGINTTGRPSPVLALCITHPNGVVELLIVKSKKGFGMDDLRLFHSQGLQILAAQTHLIHKEAIDLLSSAEKNCLIWCAKGKTSYEMGLILGLSEHTINHYLCRVLKKLDVSTRAQAVVSALKRGVIALESLD